MLVLYRVSSQWHAMIERVTRRTTQCRVGYTRFEKYAGFTLKVFVNITIINIVIIIYVSILYAFEGGCTRHKQ